jgi:hypothetical protein
MAICSGKLKVFKRMERARELFNVGDTFWYSPLAAPDKEILLSVVGIPDDMLPSGGCDNCAIKAWCGEDNNLDEFGKNYIPECQEFNRPDEKSVYFKEV